MSPIDVKHQGPAQRMIQRALARERVPHAYLFHGPDGVGKEKLALGLAATLLCEHAKTVTLDGEDAAAVGVERLRVPCASCDDCRAVAAQTHPDLHLIYRQLNRQHPDSDVRKRKGLELGVDVMRHFVIESVGLTPARGQSKVFIVREAERANDEAQNALLKTLEEPPPRTVLILLVAALDRLLPTTRSRCQLVPFGTLPTAFVRERLDVLLPSVPALERDWYAGFAEGSLGAAVDAADIGLYEVRKHVVDSLARLAGRPAAELVAAWAEASKPLGSAFRRQDPEISDTEAARRGLKAIFRIASGWYADLLHVGHDGRTASTAAASGSVDLQQAAAAINRLAQAGYHLDRNVNAQLCVEALANDLAALHAGAAARC